MITNPFTALSFVNPRLIRRLCHSAFLGLAVSLLVASDFLHAEEAGDEFNPEALYGPQLKGEKTKEAVEQPVGEIKPVVIEPVVTAKDGASLTDSDVPLKPGQAEAEIAAWGLQKTVSPEGWPLPLAGSWNVEAWGPDYFMKLTKEGHHVLMAFVDPFSEAMYALSNEKRRQKGLEKIVSYYQPGLEYAREHKLPIAFRGWNWATYAGTYQHNRNRFQNAGIPDSDRAELLQDGKLGKLTDPVGPIKAWEELGTFWFGNELMKRFQEIYPDPPMVVFLNNNEAGEVLGAGQATNGDRFIAKYGKGPYEDGFANHKVREGYDERYKAMFASAKDALVSPAWKQNVRFIAYNNLWGTTSIGNRNLPRPGLNFDNEKGWTRWRIYDGDMPELYDNDWQPAKTDNRPWSMQVEAGGMASVLPRILAERPDFLWSTIFWDGAVPSEMFRGRRASSKAYRYLSLGQRWSFERYEGWVQFCLWAARPRIAYEFRASEPLDAIRQGIWSGLLDSVDRPWNHPLLREFWQHGELVPNLAERPWYDDLSEDQPQWVRDLKRWYILTSDANPPRDAWTGGTRINVWTQALVLGKSPERRWLVYAHAPNGGMSKVRVILSEFGGLELPSVSQSGSFFLVDEKDRSLKTVMPGGPNNLLLSVGASEDEEGSKWVAPGQAVTFKASVGHAPGLEFTKFTWNFGDGKTLEQKTLEGTSHTFAKPGVYLVGIEGETTSGTKLAEQLPVYVGEAQDDSVIYDLPLAGAPAYQGPFAGVGENGQTLATYQLVPNRGKAPSPFVTGSKFVSDPERGTVLEMQEDHAGIWMQRSKGTVLTGKDITSNRTVSFWFKAEDVQKRQVLYASGIGTVGVNIYLDQGLLYAGSWATVDGVYDKVPPIYGYNWKGNWITTPVEAGKWYHVTWILKDGQKKVEPDRQSLYVNGKLVGKAPGAGIPVEYMPPRVGRSSDLVVPRTLTRFHDQDTVDAFSKKEQAALRLATFRGRLSDFRFVQAAEVPVAE